VFLNSAAEAAERQTPFCQLEENIHENFVLRKFGNF
jgi:hypothetical protein